MASEAVIRSRLQAVADGKLDLWKFADWIDSYSWNMHRDSLHGAIQLASKIHHRFAEYDIHGDESVLRRELFSLMPIALPLFCFDPMPAAPMNAVSVTQKARWIQAPALALAEL